MDFDAPESHDLFGEADEVHLDTGEDRIVEGIVTKLVEREIGSRLPIEARQDVQVEGGGDAQRVVVSAMQHQWVLLQIHDDQQAAVAAAYFGHPGEKASRIFRNKVADG